MSTLNYFLYEQKKHNSPISFLLRNIINKSSDHFDNLKIDLNIPFE